MDDGCSGPASSVSGYSIVEAADLGEATVLANGHPLLSEGLGGYAIDLFELMPVPSKPETHNSPSSSSNVRRLEDRF
jgi:hypothetical protein